MTGLVVIAVLLCALSASAQTRPNLNNNFQSPVTIQITTGTGPNAQTVEGVGQITFDFTAQMERQFYTFDDAPPINIVTRADLGKMYTVNPPTCEVQEITELAPLFGFVAQAKQGPPDEVNGIQGTTWVSSQTDPTITLLATNDGTTPLYYQVATAGQTERIIFLNFQTTFNLKPNLFKVPGQCLRQN